MRKTRAAREGSLSGACADSIYNAARESAKDHLVRSGGEHVHLRGGALVGRSHVAGARTTVRGRGPADGGARALRARAPRFHSRARAAAQDGGPPRPLHRAGGALRFVRDLRAGGRVYHAGLAALSSGMGSGDDRLRAELSFGSNHTRSRLSVTSIASASTRRLR